MQESVGQEAVENEALTGNGPGRSFPQPWIVVERADCFCVEDAAGLAVARVDISGDAEARAGGSMTRAEAHRIAKAIAMVPEMRTIIRSLQDGLAEAEAGGADA